MAIHSSMDCMEWFRHSSDFLMLSLFLSLPSDLQGPIEFSKYRRLCPIKYMLQAQAE